MNTKLSLLLFLAYVTNSIGVAADLGEFSGEVTLENRFYIDKGLYGNTERDDISLLLRPEYSKSWDNDRKVVTVIPYLRMSELDNEKTHFDIRELSFVGSWDQYELRAGVSKVFWGVTESAHLVDIINQIDAVENIDGEDRLGQPMINPTLVTDYGNFGYFFMPYFRERTFSGVDGRLRGPIIVDTDKATYSHKDEERHIDHAFRWSHYWGALEWGVSYFTGTDREPIYSVSSDGQRLLPKYIQTEQIGLELQYNYGDWLFKSEAIRKDSQFAKAYHSTVTGFEYTLSNIHQGMDIGLLYEWIYDERDKEAASGLYDASFVGTRIALNDEDSTELLAGGFIDHNTGELASYRIEASRRINENWKWEFESQFITAPPKDSLLDQIRKDDYVQLSLSFYF